MSKIDKSIWNPIPVMPAPGLASLWDIVIARSEKRFPKWKFRLEPSLIIRIQPKLTHVDRHRFECWAVMSETVADKRLLGNKKPQRNEIEGRYFEIGFDLTAPASTSTDAPWILKPTSLSCGRGESQTDTFRPPLAAIAYVFDHGRFDFITASMMLAPYCLYCGKGLTDPISQARGIGPECAGTSSPEMPWMLNLQQMAGPLVTHTFKPAIQVEGAKQ